MQTPKSLLLYLAILAIAAVAGGVHQVRPAMAATPPATTLADVCHTACEEVAGWGCVVWDEGKQKWMFYSGCKPKVDPMLTDEYTCVIGIAPDGGLSVYGDLPAVAPPAELSMPASTNARSVGAEARTDGGLR